MPQYTHRCCSDSSREKSNHNYSNYIKDNKILLLYKGRIHAIAAYIHVLCVITFMFAETDLDIMGKAVNRVISTDIVVKNTAKHTCMKFKLFSLFLHSLGHSSQ